MYTESIGDRYLVPSGQQRDPAASPHRPLSINKGEAGYRPTVWRRAPDCCTPDSFETFSRRLHFFIGSDFRPVAPAPHETAGIHSAQSSTGA